MTPYDIPGFPRRFDEMRLEPGETSAQALRRELRTRQWCWMSPPIVADLPDGWAVAYRSLWSDLVLVVREPALPGVRLWCWFWTRGRYLPRFWAFRLGFLEVGELEPFATGRWRWPLVNARFRDYAVRGALAHGKALGRAQGYEEGLAAGRSDGIAEVMELIRQDLAHIRGERVRPDHIEPLEA